jgi:hypothetical protein
MILTDNSERLNSIIVGRKICRIKFHRGVEFKFAIKSYVRKMKNVNFPLAKSGLLW